MANKKRIYRDSCRAFYAMLTTSNALRLHVESALAGRVASTVPFQEPQPINRFHGNFRRGPALRRLAARLPDEGFWRNSSGITSLLQTALAARTANAGVCALVDCASFVLPCLRSIRWRFVGSNCSGSACAHDGKYFDILLVLSLRTIFFPKSAANGRTLISTCPAAISASAQFNMSMNATEN